MLSNFDLYDMASQNNIKLDGVIFKNDLPTIRKKQNMNIIINLADDGEGTHWVCLVRRNNKFFYFDSFGVSPPEIVRKYCKKNLACNTYICQNLNSQMCGWFCFGLIYYITNNKGDFYDMCNDYVNLFEDDTKKNDKILKEYFKLNNI